MRALALMLAVLSCAAFAKPPAGGGPAKLPHDDIRPEQRARIEAELARNVAELQRAGLLAETPPLPAPMQGGMVWPLRAIPSYGAPGYHGTSNFVDLDPAFPDQLLDWNCGARTYDQAGGYNHAGIDFFTWPFPWLLMDQGAIEIIAAAPGTIIGKVDGNDDRSCPNNYSNDWNAVYVQHSDGTVAWYGHMKKSSLTAKPVGAVVAAGEFLGKVGSAGFSSGPHLHFENHAAGTGAILEPFAGTCRAGSSLWAEQVPYHDSAINVLATHSAEPDFHGVNCPNPVAETPNFSDRFQPGQIAYFAAYYRDQLGPQPTDFTIERPDGSAFDSWTFRMSEATTDPHYVASYWYWWYTLPADAPTGLWHLRASYEGVEYNHGFFVGDVLFANGFDP
jgi:murein DD-endopeptidase MepM/ murein hydrolase activator NlpD